MYGFVSTYALFVVAILLITVGEMIVMPVGQALAARFAPEAIRGRYMAFFGITWAIPGMIGPWAAGVIMDNYNPNWVWYLCGIICAIAVMCFYGQSCRRVPHSASSRSVEMGQPENYEFDSNYELRIKWWHE